jgi:hypothetical protein
LIEIFANKTLAVTLIESLPKEKTAVLATAEISLYKKFLKYFMKETHDSPVPECPLTIHEVLPLTYATPKLLGNDPKVPEIILEISISRPLIDAISLQHGVFVELSIDEYF